jgi:uncharacterized Zn finger protein
MSDTAERVALPCPSCGPSEQTVHEVLAETGAQYTVRCTECDHTHKTRIEEETTEKIDVVVSQDGESFSSSADVPVEETLAVGEEFVLDTPEALMTVRITSLELGEQRRREQAVAEDVRTIWTREVDNVPVNVTVNPRDGSNDQTRSIKVYVPGDFEFTVGETESFGEDEFTIKNVQVRDDAVGYEYEQRDHEGDTVVAKDVKRVYAWDENTTAWSAW